MDTPQTWLGRLVVSPDGADWNRLVTIYRPLLTTWATRAGVASADVDDLVQEVLIVVVRRVGEFERRGVGAFRGWLRSILANFLKQYFRKHAKSTHAYDPELLIDDGSEIARRIDEEHDQFLIHRALNAIEVEFTATTWQAFQQQVFANAKPADVAKKLGITLNATVKAKSRVLKRLREELGELGSID